MDLKSVKATVLIGLALFLVPFATLVHPWTSTGEGPAGPGNVEIVVSATGDVEMPEAMTDEVKATDGKAIDVVPVKEEDAENVTRDLKEAGAKAVIDTDAFEFSGSDLSDNGAVPTAEPEALPQEPEKTQSPDIVLIDTGCPESHPSIAGFGSTAQDGSSAYDSVGHGTNMLDVISSQAPTASVYSIRITNENGRASVSAVAKAFERARELHPKIISFSMTADNPEIRDLLAPMVDELSKDGIKVVAAAGNGGIDAKSTALGGIESAIVIGACDPEGRRLSNSNYGNTVDYYATADATSYAAALATGILASGGNLDDHPNIYIRGDGKSEKEGKPESETEKPDSTNPESGATSEESQPGNPDGGLDNIPPAPKVANETPFEPAAWTHPTIWMSWYHTRTGGDSWGWTNAGTYIDVGGYNESPSHHAIILSVDRSLGSVPDGNVVFHTKRQTQAWGGWVTSGQWASNSNNSGCAIDAAAIYLDGTLGAAYSVSYWAQGYGSDQWSASDGGAVGYDPWRSGRWLVAMSIGLNPRATDQVVMARFQDSNGNWSGYSEQRRWSVYSGNTVDAWNRAQDATYWAASIGSYYACGPATKYVDVYRRTATNTIRARYQNADGSWGGYSNVSSGSNYVGQTRSWSRNQDDTYQAASGSITGTASNQTKDVSVYRRTATNTIRVRYQNADGSWGSYSNASSGSNYVGQVRSWSRAADSVYQAASASITGTASNQTKDVSVYRQQYALTINPNGGSWNNTTSNSSFTQYAESTRSIAAPTRTGYTFVGWASVGSGSGKLSTNLMSDGAFTDGTSGASVYDNNNTGTISISSRNATDGNPIGSKEMLVTATGANDTSPGLGGWYRGQNSSANKTYNVVFVAKADSGYAFNDAMNATGDGRTVTWLSSRDGTGNWETYAYQVKCGSTGTFSTFGFNYLTNSNGVKSYSVPVAYSDIVDVTSGMATTYTYNSAKTLKALWVPNTYSVRYNANGGSGAMSSSSHTYNAAKNLSANSFTAPGGDASGYAFQGWATTLAKAQAGTVDYTPGQSVTNLTATANGVVDLYAVWKRDVSFKSGKSQAASSTATQFYGGSAVSLPQDPGTVDGWTIAGWREDGVATAPTYAVTGSVNPAANTLYAIYTRTVTLSYDANTGEGEVPESVEAIQYYNSMPSISTPDISLAAASLSRLDYAFLGWNYGAVGSPSTWIPGVDEDPTGTAEAQWRFSAEVTGIDEKNPDIDGDGKGDNLSFSTPSTVSAVLRSDGSLMFSSNIEISNLSDFDILVSSLDVEVADGWMLTDDIEHSTSANISQISIGTSGQAAVEAVDFGGKSSLPSAWPVPQGQSRTIAFSGAVKNVSADKLSAEDMCDIQWYVRADL